MSKKKPQKVKKAPEKKPLTDQQKKFVENLHLTGKPTEAARKAGYSEKTARNAAYRLTTNDDILFELRKLKEQSQEKFQITEQMLVNELMSIAFFDITNLMMVDEYSGRIRMRDDLTKLPAHIRRGLKKVSQTSNSLSQSVSFEGHDKAWAIEKLAQHMGYLKGPNAGANGSDDGNRETLTTRINRLFGEYKKRRGYESGGNSEGSNGS